MSESGASDGDVVLVQRSGDIATVVLNRPEKLNALNTTNGTFKHDFMLGYWIKPRGELRISNDVIPNIKSDDSC